MKIDKKIIKELNEYLEEFNLTEIEITEKDTKIKVSKNTRSNINQPSMVSYNSPTEKSISGNNQSIKKGETIMIVEAMKTMNHVPSSSDGVVKEICIDDGQPVEFGQTLVVLE